MQWNSKSILLSSTLATRRITLPSVSGHAMNACILRVSLSWPISVASAHAGTMVLTAKVGIPLAWTQIVSVTNHTSVVQSKCLVVVTNGVCIGHPCCMVHNSQVLLSNNWDCFCLTHAKLENICSIIGCNKQVVAGHLTCADPVHQHVESHHWDKCQSHFQLHDCLQWVHAIQLSHHATNSRALPQLAVADESHMSHHVVLLRMLDWLGRTPFFLLLGWAILTERPTSSQ